MNDKEGITLAVGVFVVIIVVKILKRFIRQPRPSTRFESTFGMPSTRAATIFFIITYLILAIKNIQTITIFIMLMVAFTACTMKFVMHEHTGLQLIVGGVVGIVLGLVANYISTKKLKKNRQ